MKFFPIKHYDSDYIDLHNIYNYARKFEYIIISVGNFEDGTPGCIIIKDIYCPIYVKGITKLEVRRLLKSSKIFGYTIKKTYFKSFEEYEENTTLYWEINITSLKMRYKALKCFEEVFYTCSGDKYKIVFGRYNLPPAGWWDIEDCINRRQIYGKTIETSIDNITLADNGPIDRAIRIGAWDIETRSYNSTKPDPTNIEPNKNGAYDIVFQISLSVRWKDGESIFRGIISTKETDDAPDGVEFIIVKDQCAAIKKYLKLLMKYKPNILYDYNGMKFDWPMVHERIKYYNIDIKKIFNIKTGSYNGYTTDIFNRKFRENTKIKVGGSFHYGTTFNMIDCMCMDLLPTLKREYDYANGKKKNLRRLNQFLEDNGIDLKHDLPYHIINRYYDTNDKFGMKECALYCLYDSESLFELAGKRLFVDAACELANSCYTDISSFLYRAVTYKIINGIMKYAYDKGYLFLKKDEYHKPQGIGAIVFPPEKGFHGYSSKMVNSEELKKELAMKNNAFKFQSQMDNQGYIDDLDEELQKMLYETLEVFPPCQAQEEWIHDRPIVGDDFSSLYPSADRVGNLCPTTISKIARPGFTKYTFADKTRWVSKDFGIIPQYLDDRYHHRMAVKRLSWKEDDPIKKKLLMVKEKNLKIILNAVYGCTGDGNNKYFYSPFIQAGIVEFSRFANITSKIINEHFGCVVQYGDTDSVYPYFKNSYFKICDDEYEDTDDRMQHIKSMVEITMVESKKLCIVINEHLMRQTGTEFFIVVYEEVLYPPLLISKKFYIGLVHEKKFNAEFYQYIYFDNNRKDYDFIDKHLLQKGVATVKSDRSRFTQLAFYDIIIKIFDPYNTKSVLENIEEYLCNISSTEDIEQFTLHALYKDGVIDTNKNKVFAVRMKELYNYELENLEHFTYYIIKRDFDLNGKRIVKVSDRMILTQFYNGEEIDIDYYIKKVIGTLKTMILYHPMFNNNPKLSEKYLTLITKGVSNKAAETRLCKKIQNSLYIEEYNIFKKERNLDLLSESQFVSNILVDIIDEINEYYYSDSLLTINNMEICFPKFGYSKSVIDVVEGGLVFSEGVLRSAIASDNVELLDIIIELADPNAIEEQKRYYNYILQERRRCLDANSLDVIEFNKNHDMQNFHTAISKIKDLVKNIIMNKARIAHLNRSTNVNIKEMIRSRRRR